MGSDSESESQVPPWGEESIQGTESVRQPYAYLVPSPHSRAGIFKQSMRARNQGEIGLSYRPARLHRLAEFIPWNRFRGPINV
jgi:hypothetical protein